MSSQNVFAVREVLPVEKAIGNKIWVDKNTILGDGIQSNPFRVNPDLYVPIEDFLSLKRDYEAFKARSSNSGAVFIYPFEYLATMTISDINPSESVILSVRLARFGKISSLNVISDDFASDTRLWVRLYPDKYHANQDKDRLSTQEYTGNGLYYESFGSFQFSGISYSSPMGAYDFVSDSPKVIGNDFSYTEGQRQLPDIDTSLHQHGVMVIKNISGEAIQNIKIHSVMLAEYDFPLPVVEN